MDSQNNATKREIKVPPGRDVHVAIYTSIRSDCSSGPLPSIRLAVAPEHRTVNFEATFGGRGAGACRVLSHRAEDFSGAVRFELDVRFSGGREEHQDFEIVVSRGPSEGQRI